MAKMDETQNPNPMKCPRCETDLQYKGTKEFHEGPGGGFLSDFTELFMNKERFDVYVCPRCGRVELFVDGIGQEFRGPEPNS
jgi:DNA-directed RNA polymerase subunit RPC12/RpoP